MVFPAISSGSLVQGSISREQAIDHGRELLRSHCWTDGYSQLRALDQASCLDVEDLEELSKAAHLTGRHAESMEFLARAHQGYAARGLTHRACRCAFWLGFYALLQG